MTFKTLSQRPQWHNTRNAPYTQKCSIWHKSVHCGFKATYEVVVCRDSLFMLIYNFSVQVFFCSSLCLSSWFKYDTHNITPERRFYKPVKMTAEKLFLFFLQNFLDKKIFVCYLIARAINNVRRIYGSKLQTDC